MDHYEQLEHEIKEAQELVDSLCPVNQEGPHQDALDALESLKEKEDVFLNEFWDTVCTRLIEREVTMMKTTQNRFNAFRENMLKEQQFSPPEIEECKGAECSSPDAFNAEDLMPAQYCENTSRLERVDDGPEIDRYCFECFYDLQACSECAEWLTRSEGNWSWDSRWDNCWVCINCHNAALEKDVDEAKEDTTTYKVTIEAVVTLTHENTDGDTSTDFIDENVIPFFYRTFDNPKIKIESSEVTS